MKNSTFERFKHIDIDHPKVVAFVTHCGGNSVTEAIHSGTPMVAIPLFGDQEHNAAVAVKRGVAVRVDKKSINTLALVEALSDVLHDERYTISREHGEVKRKPPNFNLFQLY